MDHNVIDPGLFELKSINRTKVLTKKFDTSIVTAIICIPA